MLLNTFHAVHGTSLGLDWKRSACWPGTPEPWQESIEPPILESKIHPRCTPLAFICRANTFAPWEAKLATRLPPTKTVPAHNIRRALAC